jgi:hypothetical protein
MALSQEDFPRGKSMEMFEAAVRDTAYFLWEQDGYPEGRADEYWLRALDMKTREWVANEWLRVPPKDGA